MTLLSPVADALVRLDKRRHRTEARLELSRVNGAWVAQIMADPLRSPVVGVGEIPETAIGRLVERLDAMDWREVGR